MFLSWFASKNQKIVHKWSNEHKQIVSLAHKVINSHTDGNLDKTRSAMKDLYDLAIDHLMDEDLVFYRLLKDKEKEGIDDELEEFIIEFKNTFQGTKTALMNFLTIYSKDTAVLDEDFIKSFNDFVGVLAQRIEFEENNLYYKLNGK